MFAVGLAGLAQGYDQGAADYWKRREAEDSNAALKLLGTYATQGLLSGPPPGSIPRGGGGPPAPQGPSGPPSMAGPSPGGPPSMAGPSSTPIPTGGPPPGFVNPLQIGGQAQNLTGPPIPPGGFAGPAAPSGGPPGGSVGPPGGASAGGGPPIAAMAAPGMMQRLGPPPPGGYDWRQVAREIAQSNRGADPAVIGRALLMMQPLLSQSSRAEVQLLNAQLAEQRLAQGEQRLYQNEERMQLTRDNQDLRRELGERRAGQGDRRLDIQERGQDLREKSEERRADQARQRLDLNTQKVLVQKEKAATDARNKALALEGASSARERRDALTAWKTAMDDYHRSVRERIGAAGILDKKTRKQIDDELKEIEENDKQEMQELEKRYRAMDRGGSSSRGTAAPRAAAAQPAQPAQPAVRAPSAGVRAYARDQMLDRGQPTGDLEEFQQFGPGAGGAGRAIPQNQMPAIQGLIQQFGRDAVIRDLQQQGFSTQGL